MASWTLVFSNVLNKYKDSFVAAKGNSAMRAHIIKTIKDAIGSSETVQDLCVVLPKKNIWKAICVYYLNFLEDDEDFKAVKEIIKRETKDLSAPDAITVEMVRQQEDDKPEDAGKYKTEFSSFDAYTIITNNPQALVPWIEMSSDPNHYLNSGCIFENIITRDPFHLHDMPIIHFVGYKQANFYDARTKKGAAKGKSRKKPNYVEVSSAKEGLLNKVVNSKSSSDKDEIEMEILTIADSSLKYHLARDMVPYLKSLSTVPSYQYLLTMVQKLLVCLIS
ncbi:hypothetical protein EV424DRAFT_1538642 [Suillus variegatus]|nr:hypothetical protein EV424DRAFT_1538642 [Suillus variegatus]